MMSESGGAWCCSLLLDEAAVLDKCCCRWLCESSSAVRLLLGVLLEGKAAGGAMLEGLGSAGAALPALCGLVEAWPFGMPSAFTLLEPCMASGPMQLVWRCTHKLKAWSAYLSA